MVRPGPEFLPGVDPQLVGKQAGDCLSNRLGASAIATQIDDHSRSIKQLFNFAHHLEQCCLIDIAKRLDPNVTEPVVRSSSQSKPPDLLFGFQIAVDLAQVKVGVKARYLFTYSLIVDGNPGMYVL